jgi:hypothetical protein
MRRSVTFARADPRFQRFLRDARTSGIYRLWHNGMLIKVGRSTSPTQSVGSRVLGHLRAGKIAENDYISGATGWCEFMAAVLDRDGQIEFTLFGPEQWPEIRSLENLEINTRLILWEQLKRECKRKHGVGLDQWLAEGGMRRRRAFRRRVARILDGKEGWPRV